jgi:hypothetical protein
MGNAIDLSAELGVTPQAEPEVIRAAFRAWAQRYHLTAKGAYPRFVCSLIHPTTPGASVRNAQPF